MINFSDIYHVFVDEVIFSRAILQRADLFPDESSDVIYIHDKDFSEPQIAIEFSTYDGFAIKNILREVLNIPVSIISDKNLHPEIIAHRIEVLKCAQFYPNIQNKAKFLVDFCNQQHCELNNILYFGNDLLTSFAGINGPVIVTTEKNLNKESTTENIFTSQEPHAIRKWVDGQTKDLPEVCAYYNETRQLSPEKVIIKTKTSLTAPVVFLDIDGTYTDGAMIFADDGAIWKRFSKRDINAIRQWNNLGNFVFFVTGSQGAIPLKLAKLTDTPSDHILTKAGSKKLQNVLAICAQYGINYRDVIYVGDDCNDIGVMEFFSKNGGYVACPCSAITSVKAVANCTQNAGGHGAIAEIIEQLVPKSDLKLPK